MKYVTVVFISLFLVLSSSYSQTRLERKKAKEEQKQNEYHKTKSLIESKQFKFEADWATPLESDVTNIGRRMTGGAMVFQGNRVNLTGNTNYVKLNKNEVDMFLPYFGRVLFQNAYNNRDRGIEYKGAVSELEIKHKDRETRTTVKMTLKGLNDTYKLHFIINSGGGTVLTINCTNRQSITYNGKITALIDKTNH